MKKLVLILTVLSTIGIFGQTSIKLNKSAEKGIAQEKSYPVDARPFLEKFSKANGIDLSKIKPEKSLKKSSAWGFTVGSKHTWTASDLTTTNEFYDVPSTCRAVGDNCYIFVEDDLWNKDKVDQNAVNAVLNAFEKSTPANPNKGIYQTVVENFGNPPDVDHDPRIIILILDIKDSYNGSGGYVSGYFFSYNQETDKSKPGFSHSNAAEIYYLDGVQNKLLTEAGLTNAMSTTAHEFQHMVHFNYIEEEETFFDEAWSLAAEVICGYEIYNQNLYAQEPDHYFLDWRRNDNTAVLTDYSRAARFSLYLYEQYGSSFFREFLNKGVKGFNGVTYTLGSIDKSITFSTLMENWFLANFINDKSVNPKWGYSYPGLPKMADTKYFNPNVSVSSASVYKYGVDYITFTGGSNLNVKFTTNESIQLKAIKRTSSGGVEVENVSFGTDYSLPSFGSDYSEVTFMVYMVDQNISATENTKFKYTFNATGVFDNKPIEIAYDNTEPVGLYPWDIGDSVAVVFKGVEGAKLDSIRVALRTLSPLQGGVWNIANSAKYLLGNKLASFEAVGNYYVEGNYPAKWPNWVKVDLSSYNISADKDFVVSFVIDGDYLGTNNPNNKNGPNRVMHTYQPTSQSRTYTMNGDAKGWYNFYVDDVVPQDSFIVYLIRAYVSYKTTGNNDVIELLPTSYALDQNYPNPFNPSTIITYTLPEMNNVQIKIYDALGREVRSLLNEVKSAGKHSILWDGMDNFGNRVSSGTYFYQIIAGDFVQTRKMVMVK
ncbi:putative FG-GAP repeat protein [Melioribacter roseus P3M-2]|uniref:Putative FG-GAP repeat protein n=1 Tax=Melioribacter roseus (strain DSM 23840 / JCM 17771 / VKM B-2668 / P3M-2) TaxID=1191523 RepID=I7A1G6_MELRP|nr:FlgD immunoglobulin-like domain containing protein [Melioribacter roseus]AFN75058.1 putative FG-GAP repeat protein [Melioribacter roseus P3M-2]